MEKQYTISQVSQLTGLSIDTLRYYERIGLMPDVARSGNGYRVYKDSAIGWIQFLNYLKETGMPLKTITDFIQLLRQGDDNIPERLEILEQHKSSVDQKIRDLQANKSHIEDKIQYYRKRVAEAKLPRE